MLNILVTGSNGQLGSEIKELSPNYDYKFYFTNRQTLDITNYNDIRKYIIENNINCIINCAAYTAVDKAESEQELANTINHLAVKKLAMLSNEFIIKLIHISTDYVFDGINSKPYVERDKPETKQAYGLSKLNGENSILECKLKNSIIIRTAWMYSSYGSNFVKTMLLLAKEKEELGVVSDQLGAPTYARDLARSILEILPKIDNEQVEIYNYSGEGAITWYDFAKEIMKIAKLDCKINPIESKDYPTPATRPCYSLLSKSKIKNDFNIAIPYWKDSLNECLKIMTP
jgi:dTDP-4-dehydrorhamnose reductase